MTNNLIVTALITLMAVMASAQTKTESRAFDGLTELWIDGEMTVNLRYGKEPKIDIETYNVDLDFVYTRINGDELLIRVEPIDIEDGRVTINAYMPRLKKITITRLAHVYTEKEVIADTSYIKVKTGGEVISPVDTKVIETKIASGGFMELKGKLNKLYAVVKRGGNLRTDSLELDLADIWVRTGSFAAITATGSVSAHACFGGEIKLLKIPDFQDFKNHFGGEIIMVKPGHDE